MNSTSPWMELARLALGGFFSLALAMVVPYFATLLIEAHWRPRWARAEGVTRAPVPVGDGAYREGDALRESYVPAREQCPRPLRLAAFCGYFLAQMLVPATLLWLLGLLVAVDGMRGLSTEWQPLLLLYFPGATAAVLTWRASTALLRGARDHADRATQAASVFVVGYNVALMALALVLGLVTHNPFVPLALAGYAPLSVAVAAWQRNLFLRHAEEFPVAAEPGATAEPDAAPAVSAA
ncbi:MAG: hypothetical protein R3A52_08205 [Polyangiales bacterium]